jgi:hypothetical protein
VIEARLRDVRLHFDGTILELFDRGPGGSARFHHDFMPKLEIDSGILTVINPDKTYNIFPFEDDQRAALESLIAAVEAAREK